MVGLQRDPTNFPVQYLGANVPQAWAAGTPFMLLQAMLGLQQDAPRGKLYVDPALPDWLPDVLTFRSDQSLISRAISAVASREVPCGVLKETTRIGLLFWPFLMSLMTVSRSASFSSTSRYDRPICPKSSSIKYTSESASIFPPNPSADRAHVRPLSWGKQILNSAGSKSFEDSIASGHRQCRNPKMLQSRRTPRRE